MTDNRILLVSGTPASGKDTVTKKLVELEPRFCHFKKHRSSDQPKNDGTYIHVSQDKFSSLLEQGEFLQHHYRYGRGYAVEKGELRKHWDKGEIPIIHVGKYENLLPFRNADVATISVLLLVSLAETERRLQNRHPGDSEEIARRIVAYKEERQELAALISSGDALAFDLIVDNSTDNPDKVIELIAHFCIDITGAK